MADGVEDDLDLGPVETHSQKGNGRGNVDVLGEQPDRIAGRSREDHGRLLHLADVYPVIQDERNALQALGAHGGYDLDLVQSSNGRRSEAVRSADRARRNEYLGFRSLALKRVVGNEWIGV